MQKTLLILLCTICLFAGCSKKDETLKYKINGIENIAVPNPGKLVVPIEVTHLSGEQEEITLQLDTAMPNISMSFTPSKGIPPFTTNLNIDCFGIYGGDYIVGITGTTALGKKTTFDTKISLAPHCSQELAGSYTGNDCKSNPIKIDVSPVDYNARIINIIGIREIGATYLIAEINCAEKTFTTKKETSDGELIVNGRFVFSNGQNMLTLYYYKQDGTPVYCSMNLTKQ